MFNLFKKKEEKPKPNPVQAKNSVRDTMLGDLSPAEWLGNRVGVPWSLFAEAYDEINNKQNFKAAANLYQKIVETPELESRHYLQAWHFLRKLKVNPPPEVARKVYGVLIDVVLDNGNEFVACYEDHHARYFHASGGGVIWEAPDSSLNEKIDTLLKVCEAPAAQLQPLDNVHPSAPGRKGAVQICILTPSGIHHGIGTFEGWAKDRMGGPIIAAATDLMKALTEKTAPKQ